MQEDAGTPVLLLFTSKEKTNRFCAGCAQSAAEVEYEYLGALNAAGLSPFVRMIYFRKIAILLSLCNSPSNDCFPHTDGLCLNSLCRYCVKQPARALGL